MLIPMPGTASFWRGETFVVERLFWRGRPTWVGVVRLRWLLPASRVGYRYPGKIEPDVIDRPEELITMHEEKEAA